MQEVLDSSFSLSMQTSPDFIGRTKITLKTCHYFITEKYLVIFTTITCVCTTDERIQPTNQYPEQRWVAIMWSRSLHI
ncbi:hypothetical protein KUTeg_004624 [Tegillarca granosa]|uniref:Uncharacterized protein n=1 Tax=Tegillarca granosa TaxID=220873 RepID=A0ABQ9FKM6_TEGGR|nr:hypothetical protein KUTeg_004624 [Tegillarca granosa]